MLTLIQSPRPVTFSDTETFIIIETNLPANTQNLRCVVVVKDEFGILLDKHEVSFHPDTRQAVIDIASAFHNIEPPLPPDSALGAATAALTFPNSILKYYFEYYEKYGIPSLAQTTQYSDYFLAIFGSNSSDSLLPTSNYGMNIHFLHYYPIGYRKTMTQFQPDFFYLFPRQYLDKVQCKIEIFLSNGYKLKTNVLPEFAADADKIYCLPCGFSQLDLAQVMMTYTTDTNIYPLGYSFSIWGITYPQDPPTPLPDLKMIATKNYVLYNLAPPNTKYIAFQNDFGGIETQYFPMWKTQLEVEKISNELVQFNEKDKRTGTRTERTMNRTEKHSLRTLPLPLHENVLMSKIIENAVWLITEDGFERIYVDTKSIALSPSHKTHDPFAFSFKRYLD